MAARRLIALLVALLVISSIATALAPPPASDDETDSTSTTTTAPDPKAETPETEVVEAVIDTGAEESAPPVEAAVGDQLSLVVRSDTTSQIEIQGLGLYGVAAPGAPALFDVVLWDEGALEVTADGRPAGEILVGEKARKASKRDSGRDPEEEPTPQEDPPKERKRQASGSSVAA